MNAQCGINVSDIAPKLRLQIIGQGEDVLRLKKRLNCATSAMGMKLSIELLPDDIRAAELGARRGPLVVMNGAIIADGLEPVESIQASMEWQLQQESLKT